jgi:anti-sigma B factor antagonist
LLEINTGLTIERRAEAKISRMALQSQEPLEIVETTGPQPDQRILTLRGPVVLATLFQFQNAIRTGDSRALVIDFTGVPYIDSAGIGALVGAQVNRSKDGRSLALVGVSERVRNALKVTHVDSFFRFFTSQEDALR